jgi:hypothetical protein
MKTQWTCETMMQLPNTIIFPSKNLWLIGILWDIEKGFSWKNNIHNNESIITYMSWW